MFDPESSSGFIIDQVDPLEEARFRSSKASSLETKFVVNDNLISGKEVRDAHKAWTDALVSISQTHKKQGLEAAKDLAGDVIDGAYAYQLGAVAFKPTWTSGDTTFRTTREGAVSYFVGNNDNFDDHIRDGVITREFFRQHVVSYQWIGRKNELLLNLPYGVRLPHL